MVSNPEKLLNLVSKQRHRLALQWLNSTAISLQAIPLHQILKKNMQCN